jgi:GDP-D-mannose 3',5'-epimerase
MNVLVCGAGGFIGGHMVSNLKQQGYHVTGVDIKNHEYKQTDADIFYQIDLRNQSAVMELFANNKFDRIYQLSANMGGAGFVFVGTYDAEILADSAQINLNIINAMKHHAVNEIFYTSSACIYPGHIQLDPSSSSLKESQAYPAAPDSEYGWEKIFGERLYLAHAKNLGWRVRIARLHNVYGPYGAWNNGKEKSPAALCRKVAQASNSDTIEVWGTGNQTRSFMYIDECIEGINRLCDSDYGLPINLGSRRMISINDLVQLISKIDNKNISINHIPGPVGVLSRNSDNNLIQQILNWEPKDNLEYGIEQTYNWIKSQL